MLCLRQLRVELDPVVSLEGPSHAIITPNGQYIVSDTKANLLKVVSLDGTLIHSVVGHFDGPYGLALSSEGLYIADCRSNQLEIVNLELTNRRVLAKFRSPIAVALDGEFAFVTEQVNHTVAVLRLATGIIEHRMGGEGSGDGELWCPYGIAARSDTLYIADSWNHRIARFTFSGKWLGAWGREGASPGRFRSPYGVAVTSDALLVSEDTGKRLQVANRE